MDLNKFTERSRGFIQAAQTIAQREDHQRLLPEHILKALMDDDQGLASNLITRSGGAPARVVEALDVALGKIAKVSGDAGQVYLDSQTAKVLDEAEKLAKKAAQFDAELARAGLTSRMVLAEQPNSCRKCSARTFCPCANPFIISRCLRVS